MKRENVIFGAVFLAIGILSMLIIWPFVPYILMAAILAYTLFPVFSWIRRRTGRPEISAGLSLLVALVLLVIPSFLLVQRLAQEVTGALATLQLRHVQEFGDYLSGVTGNRFDFDEALTSLSSQIQTSIVGMAPDIVGSLTEWLLGIFIMIFVMYYAFKDGEVFVRRLKRALPLDPVLKDKLFAEIRSVTHAVLYGQVMTAVIQGSAAMLGFLIFGVANWVFWGIVMILLSFLPVVGPPIIWVPAAVFKILQGEMIGGIGLLVYGIIVVSNIDNVVRPKLVSSRSKVHPVLIIVGVLGGLKMVGFSGMLVGPLILALLIALVQFWEDIYMRPVDRPLASDPAEVRLHK